MSQNTRYRVESRSELRAICEVQKDFAEASVLHSETVWDVSGPDQSDILMRKLNYMFPDDKKVYTSKEETRKIKKYNANVNNLKRKLFTNIWQQRKYTNGALLHSIVYVMVTSHLNMEEAKFAHNYTIHPLFRTRRCLKNDSTAGCCMIFIDEKSRIYKNWNDFVTYNELPYGIMIAPKSGCYKLDDENKVDLECFYTPAYSRRKLTAADNVVSVASLVAQSATIFNPIFSIMAIGTKTYETIRNYQKMSDKVAKGTATSCKANLNLAGDIISLTSSVATFGAHMTVNTGEKLSFGAELSLQTVNGAAALVHCTKLIITTYDLFTRYFIDGEKLDFSDVLAFGSSLILFTNSVNNIVITSQIGEIDGNKLRSLLQSKIRAGLIVASKAAIKYVRKNCGSLDILRLVNDIPYKDMLCNLHTVYKTLTPSGFLATLSTLGALALEISPGLHAQIVNKEINELDFEKLLKHYGSKFVQHITNSFNLIDVLNGIGLYFSEHVLQFLVKQTRVFIETKADAIDSKCFYNC